MPMPLIQGSCLEQGEIDYPPLVENLLALEYYLLRKFCMETHLTELLWLK